MFHQGAGIWRDGLAVPDPAQPTKPIAETIGEESKLAPPRCKAAAKNRSRPNVHTHG